MELTVRHQKQVKPLRNSNIELLRFILAIFVVVWHYFSLSHYLSPILVAHVNGFAMISGFFLVNSNDDYRFLRFTPSIFIFYMSNIILLVIFSAIFDGFNQVDWMGNLEYGPSSWWYIWAIWFIYALSPFLNYGMRKINKNLLLVIIVFIWLAYQIGGVLHHVYQLTPYSYGSFVILLYCYLLGGYLKLHGANYLRKKWLVYTVAATIILVAIMFKVLYVFVYPDAPRFFDFTADNTALMSGLVAFAIFTCFLTINIKPLVWINFLGKISIYIYVYHLTVWEIVKIIKTYYGFDSTSDVEFKIYCLGLTFLFSLAIYFPYQYYNYYANKLVNKIINKFFITKENNYELK